jgi:hypothetical protein
MQRQCSSTSSNGGGGHLVCVSITL